VALFSEDTHDFLLPRFLTSCSIALDVLSMAHPIRPESYISMDNFYTATVYVKGAEVIRMYQTLLTPEGFRKGMDLYFKRHDGSAVTCDDFRAAMADANNVDLTQFGRWYETAGTPTIKYDSSYHDGTLSLTLNQSSQSPNPLHVPVAVGLLDKTTGFEVLPTTVLELKQERQTFTFPNLQNDVVPSILRDFSAPVKLVPASGSADEESIAFLAAHDTDSFNRWEAGQILYTSLIFQTLDGADNATTREYVEKAIGQILSERETRDYSIQAYSLTLPSESTLVEDMKVIDPIGVHKARGLVKKALARKFHSEIQARYEELTMVLKKEAEFILDAESIGRRRLRNVLLEYLCSIRDTEEEQTVAAQLAMTHYSEATGMTDKMAGLTALVSMDGAGASARDNALSSFYKDAEGDALVLNKWFTVQALADLPDVLERVKLLTEHPDFTLKNPNRFRSLIGAFTANAAAFHDESGAGYEFIGKILKDIDELNPQVSSRLANCLISWKRYDNERGMMMSNQLKRLSTMKLSDDLFEVVNRSLKQ
jgi:aminopeptidase N